MFDDDCIQTSKRTCVRWHPLLTREIWATFPTCDLGIFFGLGGHPFPPDRRHFGGTLVGEAGTVLLVAPVLFSLSGPVLVLSCQDGRSVLLLGRLVVKSDGAVRWAFLPLKPARQRSLSLKVKVPAAEVFLSYFKALDFHFSVELLVIHRAKQRPAHAAVHVSNVVVQFGTTSIQS